MATIERVCAWCRKSLGKASGEYSPRFPVTHGICAECSAKVLAEVRGDGGRAFLDGLGAPVLVVDDDMIVLAANRPACDLLGRTAETVVGLKGGDAIECVHSRSPRGCGGTVHCRSCTIRLAVKTTYDTGMPFSGIPAYPDTQLLRKDKDACLRISTEKVGGCVLLRIGESGRPETRG